MEVSFQMGHIFFDDLQSCDSLVCPTDTSFSGSGGLDRKIHEAAGPRLTSELKGKHLSEGEVLTTEGFDLGVRHILHAAVPKCTPSAAEADALFHCYRKILIPHEDAIYPARDPRSIVISLLGTGSCGWSYEQSLDALWRAILTYQHKRGNSGVLEKIRIHYPGDILCSIIDSYTHRASQAFFSRPRQLGFRKNLGVWYALMDHFDNPKFSHISPGEFIRELQRFFHAKTGTWLCGDTDIHLPEWAYHSNDSVTPDFAALGIPFLCSNLCRLYGSDSRDFILPVTLQGMELTLPYELLPELTALRKNAHALTEQKRLPLDLTHTCFLSTYHYRNTPELVDHYSLDVEKAADSHYEFSPQIAQMVCSITGFHPNALGAALTGYLKEHGEFSLVSLLTKLGATAYHYD